MIYLQQGSNVSASVHLFVYPPISEEVVWSFQPMFVKPSRITFCCSGKNMFIFGVDTIQNALEWFWISAIICVLKSESVLNRHFMSHDPDTPCLTDVNFPHSKCAAGRVNISQAGYASRTSKTLLNFSCWCNSGLYIIQMFGCLLALARRVLYWWPLVFKFVEATLYFWKMFAAWQYNSMI